MTTVPKYTTDPKAIEKLIVTLCGQGKLSLPEVETAIQALYSKSNSVSEIATWVAIKAGLVEGPAGRLGL